MECSVIGFKDNKPEVVTVEDDGLQPFKPSDRNERRRKLRKSRLSLKKSTGNTSILIILFLQKVNTNLSNKLQLFPKKNGDNLVY